MDGQRTGMPAPPHDVMGLTPLTPVWVYGLWLSIAMLIMAALSWWIWSRRKPKKISPAVVESDLPGLKIEDPRNRLLRNLALLKPHEPFDSLAQMQYFSALTLYLREAIELKTAIRATDMTVNELYPYLEKSPFFDADERLSVLSFLDKADRIKFAGEAVTIHEAEAALRRAMKWTEKWLHHNP